MGNQIRLYCRKTDSYIPLDGRVVTIGSSRECHINPGHNSMPSIAAHLLFSKGSYDLQPLTSGIRISLNGKEIERGLTLKHGDTFCIGDIGYIYCERDLETAVKKDPASPLEELIQVIVSLLRNKDEEVFSDLVASVARLLHCDASRLVVEDSISGQHKTVARYPLSAGLDRFSSRAIKWAKEASKTIIMHEDEWKDESGSNCSLQKNLIGSVMCAPLKQGTSISGFLYLDRIHNSEGFNNKDREYCDALLPLFSVILENYQERKRQKETIARLQQAKSFSSGSMIYESEIMSRLIHLAEKLARTDSPVLILGETGTGKELMARYVHEKSMRSQKPFKAINCGAIPENLIESELFGHEKGAFTGAVQRKIGLFEAAEGGTVFLDETGELPLPLQVKLLRVLQESEIVRIGGTDTIKVSVRIIAATNKNLEMEVNSGRFRQDLYFRLNVLTLNLPPLRDRGSDILLLADFFILKYCTQFGLSSKTISAKVKNELLSYSWPGNIRELENIIQKAILLSEGKQIEPEYISLNKSSLLKKDVYETTLTLKEARSHAERQTIVNALKKTRGNVSLSSKILEIDRKWLMKKMDELDVSADDYRH